MVLLLFRIDTIFCRISKMVDNDRKCQTPSKRRTNKRRDGQRDASLSVSSFVWLRL